MQNVFNLIHDLENVNTLYKEHIDRNKRATEGMTKIAIEKLKRHSVKGRQPSSL